MIADLEARIRTVLARLALLSEAPASRPSDMALPETGGTDDKGRKHKRPDPLKWNSGGASAKPPSHDSKPPPGVSNNIKPTDPSQPPDPERSLADWHAWHFAQAFQEFTDPAELARRLNDLLYLAEDDYLRRSVADEHRRKLRKGELTENDVRDGGLAEREANKRVIACYEDWSPKHVAIYERTTEAQIRKARRMAGRRESDGRPRSKWYTMSEDEKLAYAERRQEEKVGYRVAADQMQVGHGVMRRYYEKVKVAA